jgi:hypothetical protein
VPAGDATALTAAMADVLRTTPRQLTEMGRRGAQRVRERHDVSQEAGRLRRHFAESAGMSLATRSDSPSTAPVIANIDAGPREC